MTYIMHKAGPLFNARHTIKGQLWLNIYLLPGMVSNLLLKSERQGILLQRILQCYPVTVKGMKTCFVLSHRKNKSHAYNSTTVKRRNVIVVKCMLVQYNLYLINITFCTYKMHTYIL